MNIIPWRKKDDSMHPLQKQMNSMFDSFFKGFDLDISGGGFSPALDVNETPEAVIVKAEIPGIPVKDVDISLTGDVLTISGEKKDEKEEKGENYHRVERSFGSFRRSVSLPSYIDAAKVEASAKDGILTITIGKKPEVKPRKIDVKVR